MNPLLPPIFYSSEAELLKDKTLSLQKIRDLVEKHRQDSDNFFIFLKNYKMPQKKDFYIAIAKHLKGESKYWNYSP